MSTPSIRIVTLAEVLPLRQKLLKPFLNLSDCLNPGDFQAGTFHLGAHFEGELVGVATFEVESTAQLSQPGPWARLRGMAVSPEVRRHGFGRSLVLKGEQILQENHFQGLWFNARETAFAFYASMGYETNGEMFELPRIGPHKVMYKHWGAS